MNHVCKVCGDYAGSDWHSTGGSSYCGEASYHAQRANRVRKGTKAHREAQATARQKTSDAIYNYELHRAITK